MTHNKHRSDAANGINRRGPTIFTRIMIGYLAIFIPAVAMSAYAFSQLIRSRTASGEILKIDSRTKDLVQKIADSILTQVRFERKYMLTKDEDLIKQFELAKEDVYSRIDEAVSVADNAQKQEILNRIKSSYDIYRYTFEEEVRFAKEQQSYAEDEYKEKKEKTVDGILLDLKNLRLYSEQDAYEKMERLGKSVAETNNVAIAIASCFIILGIIISIFITRSITLPISIMRRKTKRVAGGDFDIGLDLSSPPEIGELARDFNMMCGKLKDMDKMKTDFFSLMAHELRTPLACIKEGTSLLQKHGRNDVQEKREEILAIIKEESDRLTDLVNSLLDLSRMEAGMVTLHLEKCDIGHLIQKAVFGLGTLAMTKNASIGMEIQRDIQPVNMDAERILQVLRNLIGNAIKFTPAGGQISISAQLAKEGLKVSIADTGPGIAREDLTLIFDKFRQGTMTNYNTIKGTGLGLAIVKHIVSAHGGKVWVESEVGHGSVFIFVLPV